ncbi:MAG TPA: 7,8-didemethyl-8-hydroxy-5-deazariboflavin synthase CofG [Candidatus Nitrosopolaris sp.]|nr:7,8-didemethyl-8-hydroxy-5-deazariboflavin synthase CofG [Candidatus Nitrosopolaris sp.]
MLATKSDPGVLETLVKSLEGRYISKTEAMELFSCHDQDAILSTARLIRKKTKSGPITYSRKIFINLINLCRDSCTYCTYKKEPDDKSVSMMRPPEIFELAQAGKKSRCTEALFVTGERPEQRYVQARSWLHSLGHTTTVEYIREMSEMILQKTGLLPHTNAGSMTKKEMSLLKHTNVSLGVMLESSSERLASMGMPHEMAPSKNPKVRIKTLENAGDLMIPITTGLLVGIGEEPQDIIDSLFLIKDIHRKYGHVQEVIIQNFAPKPGTQMSETLPPAFDFFLTVVGVARIVLRDMNIQVPPNLNPYNFGKYLNAGINDWGGISPLTIDHVNPEFPWPSISSVRDVTQAMGYSLRARLPVYPEFLLDNKFISGALRPYLDPLRDVHGLVPEEYLA